jgi:sugar lactone lactonase YvrE
MRFSFAGRRPRLAACGLLLAAVAYARFASDPAADAASTSQRIDAATDAASPGLVAPGGAVPSGSAPGGAVHPSSIGDLATLAGGFLGDGGAATSAMFASAWDVAVAANGDVYVSDTYNHRVRKFTPGGAITTIAGNGTSSAAGDGGLAVAAGLNLPTAIALDAAGNLLIADSGNHRVRRVTPGGVISTIAGTGVAGSLGDGGPAASAQLNDPEGLALDAAGNVYVAEHTGNRVRKFAVGGSIQTIAGTGVASFSGDGGVGTAATLNRPSSLVVSASGDVFIADVNNHRVRKLTAGGTISTYAGNGTTTCSTGGVATSASITAPSGLALDAAGQLYVSGPCDMVLVVSPGNTLAVVAGTTETGFNGDGDTAGHWIYGPAGMDLDAFGGLVFADAGNNLVRRVALSAQTITTIAGRMNAVDGALAVGGMLGAPEDVAFGPSGELYVAEGDRSRVRRMDPDGTIYTVAGNGRFGRDGDGGPATFANLGQLMGIGVLPGGELVVADRYYGVVRMIALSGVISTVAGAGINTVDNVAANTSSIPGVTALAVGPDGSVYIATRNKVRRFTVGGLITTVAGTGASSSGTAGYNGDGLPATLAQLNAPQGLGVDDTGALYIADTNNHRIRKVVGGIISTVAGNGVAGTAGDGGAATSASLQYPRGVDVDRDGRIYISDSNNARIRAVSTDGSISTVAGTGVAGFNAEAGTGAAVQLAQPRGIAVRSDGLLAISDRNNLRVRGLLVTPPQPYQPGTLSIADASITEGNAGTKSLSLVVSLSKTAPGQVWFEAATDSGTAHPGADYVSLAPTTFMIPAGQLSVTITIPIVGDAVAEADEDFVVNLRSPSGATISRGQARARIINDDRPTLYVEDAQVVEGAAGAIRTVQVVVRLSVPASRAVTAYVRTAGSIGAIPGVDYEPRSDTMVVFDAGRTRQVFDVRIIGDGDAEGPESLQVAARGLGDGAFDIGRQEGTVTILDDDGAAATSQSPPAAVTASLRLAPRQSSRSRPKSR